MTAASEWAGDQRAAEMRAAFDATFARARVADGRDADHLLALRLGGDRYAVRMEEIASLVVDRRVTPLPSPVPELAGLAGMGGVVVPVYDLARLLGYASTERTRWLALLAPASVAVTFAVFDGYVVRPSGEIAFEAAEGHGRHVRVIARAPDFVRPVVSLASVLEAIRRRMPPTNGSEERG